MMRETKLFLITMISLLCGVEGCGSSSSPQDCGYSFVVNVTPSAATLDHMASSTANKVQFVGIGRATAPAGCPVPTDLTRLEYASWSNSDPTDIQISSARDQTNGTAVCLGATKGAVNLTGTFTPITASGISTDTSVNVVTLTCN